MEVLIVHAHPEPCSFNAAMTRLACEVLREEGHAVALSDLYAIGFEAASSRANFTTVSNADYLTVQDEERNAAATGGFAPQLEAEIAKLERCALMIWQFPLWWFGVPAILKGWVDRVFAMGRIYDRREVYATGRLRGRKALLSLTTGSPQSAFGPDGFNGDIDAILRPLQRGMLEFVGLSVLRPHIVWQPARLSAPERAAELARWGTRLRAIGEEEPIAVGRY